MQEASIHSHSGRIHDSCYARTNWNEENNKKKNEWEKNRTNQEISQVTENRMKE